MLSLFRLCMFKRINLTFSCVRDKCCLFLRRRAARTCCQARARPLTASTPAPGRRGANNSLRGLSGIRVADEPVAARRPGKRLTSPERWEVTQLIKAGVLDITEYPTFDEEGQARPR